MNLFPFFSPGIKEMFGVKEIFHLVGERFPNIDRKGWLCGKIDLDGEGVGQEEEEV